MIRLSGGAAAVSVKFKQVRRNWVAFSLGLVVAVVAGVIGGLPFFQNVLGTIGVSVAVSVIAYLIGAFAMRPFTTESDVERHYG